MIRNRTDTTWSVKQGPIKGYLEVWDDEGHVIAQLIPDEVAARIIASAPEMLRALERMLDHYYLNCDYDATSAAEDVVAKATGIPKDIT